VPFDSYMTHVRQERRGAYRAKVRTREGKRPFEDLGARGRIILKWVLNNSKGIGLNLII